MNMVDEYLAAYPPESFYAHEGRGGYVPDAPYERPGPAGGAALTRENIEAAEAELAAAHGTTASLVHDAALEFCGIDPRSNQDFVSLSQYGAAVAQLAMGTGVRSAGPVDVADEIARITQDAPWRQYTNRSGQRVSQPMVDPAKAARALQPVRERFAAEPPEPQLSAEQETEIVRLCGTDLRRASYPLRRGPRDKGSVGLTQGIREVGRLIELAADGSTTSYQSNGATVTEYDATDPGQTFTDDEIDAEVARFHNMAAQLFGITPTNDNGNRSYAPPDRSTFGQRTQPGASWFSGQG
jgi:hypothetical protein